MDLKRHVVRYDPADVRAWQAGKYELLKRSRASEFIKQILVEKATHRRRARRAAGRSGDRRFFGEAFVAAHQAFAHRTGWYGSFQAASRLRYAENSISTSSSMLQSIQIPVTHGTTPCTTAAPRQTCTRTFIGPLCGE